MKNHLIMFALFLALPLSACADETSKGEKWFSIQSGIIEYEIKSDVSEGKTRISGIRSLYFKDYGELMLEEEQSIITQSGSQTKTHTMKKYDKKTLYNVDFINKKIIKSNNSFINRQLFSNKDINKDSLNAQGSKLIGTDSVLGYSCDIWDVMGLKQCLYKNQIPLWIDVNIMGIKNRVIAVTVNFNSFVSEDLFSLPKFPISISPNDKT